MASLVGYQLLDQDNNVVQGWGGVWGQCPGMPTVLYLPNGDHVHAPELNVSYTGYTLVEWYMDQPATPEFVNREKDRRLALGFDYDFGDERGVHHIGTTDDDMKGWSEVTTWATVSTLAAVQNAQLSILTDTGQATITPTEWFSILAAATNFRQPIWQASFALTKMDPIPSDYTDDKYWTSQQQ